MWVFFFWLERFLVLLLIIILHIEILATELEGERERSEASRWLPTGKHWEKACVYLKFNSI